MRYVSTVLVALAALFASPAFAQFGEENLGVEVEPVVEGKAIPGEDYSFKLRYTVPDGYHAYHKDNPGINMPAKVEFDELSGLTLKDQSWPEPEIHEDEYGVEWELSGTFEVTYTFAVPDGASGPLTVTGSHETQYCKGDMCYPSDGTFEAVIEVAGAPEKSADLPEVDATAEFVGTAAPGGTAELALRLEFTEGYHTYHKDNPGYGLAPTVEFTELSGLTLEETTWPEPAKHEYAEDWIEWEHKNELVLTYRFNVPEDADGDVAVALSWKAQVCNEAGCWDRDGDLTSTLTVAAPVQNDATDEHGFYVDFDYALEKARKENKLLLADFNGEN